MKISGISKTSRKLQKEFKKGFAELSAEEKLQFVNNYDKEAKEYQSNKKEDDANHFFTMLKQLTLTGFFTSEVGMKQALRYVKIPGKFDGNYPYKKGDKAWAI